MSSHEEGSPTVLSPAPESDDYEAKGSASAISNKDNEEVKATCHETPTAEDFDDDEIGILELEAMRNKLHDMQESVESSISSGLMFHGSSALASSGGGNWLQSWEEKEEEGEEDIFSFSDATLSKQLGDSANNTSEGLKQDGTVIEPRPAFSLTSSVEEPVQPVKRVKESPPAGSRVTRERVNGFSMPSEASATSTSQGLQKPATPQKRERAKLKTVANAVIASRRASSSINANNSRKAAITRDAVSAQASPGEKKLKLKTIAQTIIHLGALKESAELEKNDSSPDLRKMGMVRVAAVRGRSAPPDPPGSEGSNVPLLGQGSMPGSQSSSKSSVVGVGDPTSTPYPSNVSSASRGKASYSRRNYEIGQNVLVYSLSRWANPVNRFGFPQGGGRTFEERTGPYIYVLATIEKIHFEEEAQYYTVTRADTGASQRADKEYMTSIPSEEGEAAALAAANQSFPSVNENHKTTVSSAVKSNSQIGKMMKQLRDFCASCARAMKMEVHLFLNGMEPYECSSRFTSTSVLVICSTWYMFIDQARLALFPPGADHTLAIFSFLAWIVLVIELITALLVRPIGYKALLLSSKAFDPGTVIHLNNFHLVVEAFSLLLFIPEFSCIFTRTHHCGDATRFSILNATIYALLGVSKTEVLAGRVYFALVRLRVFGMVRYCQQLWIKHTVVSETWNYNQTVVAKDDAQEAKSMKESSHSTSLFGFPSTRSASLSKDLKEAKMSRRSDYRKGSGDLSRLISTRVHQAPEEQEQGKEVNLTNATNIGMALMVVNSHRAFILIFIIMGILPLLNCFREYGGASKMPSNMVEQLQFNNALLTTVTNETCAFLQQTIEAWVLGLVPGASDDGNSFLNAEVYILWLEVLPSRCDFQLKSNLGPPFCSGLERVTSCTQYGVSAAADIDELAERVGTRTGALTVESQSEPGFLFFPETDERVPANFTVTAVFNQEYTVNHANFSSFILQILVLVFVLGGLAVLRGDAERLVLGPLRDMLKIVARYANDPLVETGKKKKGIVDDGSEVSDKEINNNNDTDDQLGHYETEQLINAISKITELLRKCWGVAGADIISSNLTHDNTGLAAVINPCIPGKSVYALFAFASITGFEKHLHALGSEVMILINDVAAVLHDEVYRWGFEDSGQCNKNLGSAFLMVYRIGEQKEVKDKLRKATSVIWTTASSSSDERQLRRRKKPSQLGVKDVTSARTTASRLKSKLSTFVSTRNMTLSLGSLPGINVFADRALIGMLKAFASMQRNRKIREWRDDFRLGAGVKAFMVEMIFGIDAGWAVEGAVGSEFKIDATYLSPHVNMASRMMSACKQYGVTILLSQAVEELLSRTARSKLRHLDTVTVKGSTLRQSIYTYDARHEGVDFFLHARTDEQADSESERYSRDIWDLDPDLTAMRQHVTDEFLELFNKGRDEYIAGKWPAAVKSLSAAVDCMVTTAVEDGYFVYELEEIRSRVVDRGGFESEEELVRSELGDKASLCLIAYMEKEGGIAPPGWKGYRPLTAK